MTATRHSVTHLTSPVHGAQAPDPPNGATLSDEPTLLFLHGIGTGDPDDVWRVPMSKTLEVIGYPTLDQVQVIAPKYSHELKGFSEKQDVPPFTIKQPIRDAARQNRRDFERRIAAIEFRLGRHDHGNGNVVRDAIVGSAVNLPVFFAQAQNYLGKPAIRAQVLRKILGSLPTSGRIMIVAHSLGSVIAADLLRRLPIGLEVVGMVTIGSPLANGNFDTEKLRDALEEPPTNLGWWINFWNSQDPVAANRGVSSVFPWLVDLRIPAAPPTRAHSAVTYLADETIAEAVGYALFGSRSKEIDKASTTVDIPLDPAERYAVLAIRFGDLVAKQLDGDLKDRYRGALRQVHATVIESILQRNAAESRGVPHAIGRLAFDFSDPDAKAPASLPSPHLPADEAAILLAVLATENIIRPFEITVRRDQEQKAMKELTAEMGLTSQFGARVFEAAKEAREVLAGSRGVNWVRIGILGAGAAALVVASGGLVLAAGAGLAGAAALTSALAAFGPGGMIGGLLTAGTLMTAGGGGIAYSLASLSTSAEAMEGIVERQLTLVILRQRRNLEQDPEVWRNFSEAEAQVRREHERLDEFSDRSSAALKELKKKITTLERALAYLRENGLEPGKVVLDGDA